MRPDAQKSFRQDYKRYKICWYYKYNYGIRYWLLKIQEHKIIIIEFELIRDTLILLKPLNCITFLSV